MPTRFRPTFALAALLALGLSAPAPPEGDGEVGAIRRLLDRQVEDWNRKDLDGFLGGYWHAPGLVFQSGATRTEGFEAMRSRYRARYLEGGREMGSLTFSGVEIELLGPDSAFARGRWRLAMSDGTRPGGLFTLILKKRPEGWKIVHDHTSA
jgi:beta-aspartyl-peptidase (threonine type)